MNGDNQGYQQAKGVKRRWSVCSLSCEKHRVSVWNCCEGGESDTKQFPQPCFQTSSSACLLAAPVESLLLRPPGYRSKLFWIRSTFLQKHLLASGLKTSSWMRITSLKIYTVQLRLTLWLKTIITYKWLAHYLRHSLEMWHYNTSSDSSCATQ